jgi:hypothetical protein
MSFRSARPPQVRGFGGVGGAAEEAASGVPTPPCPAATRLPPHCGAQPATARLLLPGDPWLSEPDAPAAAGAAAAGEQAEAAPVAAAAASSSGGGGGESGSGRLHGRAAAAAAVAAGRRLLLVDFTKDPPDEFRVGANFVCGLPFPFISIRTARLAVRRGGRRRRRRRRRRAWRAGAAAAAARGARARANGSPARRTPTHALTLARATHPLLPQGVVDVDTGEVTLEFVSQFLAQVGPGGARVREGCQMGRGAALGEAAGPRAGAGRRWGCVGAPGAGGALSSMPQWDGVGVGEGGARARRGGGGGRGGARAAAPPSPAARPPPQRAAPPAPAASAPPPPSPRPAPMRRPATRSRPCCRWGATSRRSRPRCWARRCRGSG